jgi:hypothetical protein
VRNPRDESRIKVRSPKECVEEKGVDLDEWELL